MMLSLNPKIPEAASKSFQISHVPMSYVDQCFRPEACAADGTKKFEMNGELNLNICKDTIRNITNALECVLMGSAN